MRKAIISIISVLMMMCLCLPVYAASETRTDTASDVQIDVSASFRKNESDPSRAYCAISDGRASVDFGGNTVSVSGVQADGLTLVVLPVPKSEISAWSWFEKCLKDYGTKLLPLDIYFMDENGDRAQYNGSFSVSITPAELYTSPRVYYLTPNEQVTAMNLTTSRNTVTFTTSHNSYYILAQKKTSILPTPSDPSSPKTGDSTHIELWTALLCISAAGLVGLVVYGKMKKDE